MAVPKRRQTSGRGKRRRSHDHIKKPSVAECPQCGNPKQSHRVCPTCGFYRKREVIEVLD